MQRKGCHAGVTGWDLAVREVLVEKRCSRPEPSPRESEYVAVGVDPDDLRFGHVLLAAR
jgi:hypothetical protein